jgi:hypothetical protein
MLCYNIKMFAAVDSSTYQAGNFLEGKDMGNIEFQRHNHANCIADGVSAVDRHCKDLRLH